MTLVIDATFQFTSAEDVISAFTSAVQDQSAAMFTQGDILLAALEPETLRRIGFENSTELFTEVGRKFHMGKSSVYARASVSRTFPPDRRNPEADWSIHELCSRTESPDEWLAYAVEHDLSVRRLRMAIEQADGKAVPASAPEFVVDAVLAEVLEVQGNTLVLRFIERASGLTIGDLVRVTICTEPEHSEDED